MASRAEIVEYIAAQISSAGVIRYPLPRFLLLDITVLVLLALSTLWLVVVWALQEVA